MRTESVLECFAEVCEVAFDGEGAEQAGDKVVKRACCGLRADDIVLVAQDELELFAVEFLVKVQNALSISLVVALVRTRQDVRELQDSLRIDAEACGNTLRAFDDEIRLEVVEVSVDDLLRGVESNTSAFPP